MKKYALNPKEELKLEIAPDLMAVARKKNRVFLVGSIILIIMSLFFWYVMQSIPNFYPLLLLIGLIAIACLIYYISGITKGFKESDEKYYITNVRVVVADDMDNIKKEIYLNDIKKVNYDKVLGKICNVSLNPKEETNPAKIRKHTGNEPLYTADTIILSAVNGEVVKEYIGK